MIHVDDLSRSLIAFEQISTLVIVVELSQSSLQRGACPLGDLELNRTVGLVLDNCRPISHVAAYGDVIDAKADEIATASAIFVACRLTSLSALEADYASLVALPQLDACCQPKLSWIASEDCPPA
jgi:hypothetical protein